MRRSIESLPAKNALVTGTSRGIGRALAQAFSDAGARVLCHARTLAAATEVAEAVGGVPIFGDLGRPAELEQIAGSPGRSRGRRNAGAADSRPARCERVIVEKL